VQLRQEIDLCLSFGARRFASRNDVVYSTVVNCILKVVLSFARRLTCAFPLVSGAALLATTWFIPL
jgi:hypothetical protein